MGNPPSTKKTVPGKDAFPYHISEIWGKGDSWGLSSQEVQRYREDHRWKGLRRCGKGTRSNKLEPRRWAL